MSIYEKAFEKSDKTDAVLVIDGKKLHVNKALLSHHSAYFKTLFNSESSSSKYPIKDVKFEDLATVLSFVHQNPIIPKDDKIADLLELAQALRFPAATKYLEMYLLNSKEDHIQLNPMLIYLADKYQLDTLLEQELKFLQQRTGSLYHPFLGMVSDETKLRIFNSQVSTSCCTIL